MNFSLHVTRKSQFIEGLPDPEDFREQGNKAYFALAIQEQADKSQTGNMMKSFFGTREQRKTFNFQVKRGTLTLLGDPLHSFQFSLHVFKPIRVQPSITLARVSLFKAL